jgi:hypothetical protein
VVNRCARCFSSIDDSNINLIGYSDEDASFVIAIEIVPINGKMEDFYASAIKKILLEMWDPNDAESDFDELYSSFSIEMISSNLAIKKIKSWARALGVPPEISGYIADLRSDKLLQCVVLFEENDMFSLLFEFNEKKHLVLVM